MKYTGLLGELNFGFLCRLIGTIKGRIGKAHDEDTFQELLAITCRERHRVRAGTGGHIAKASLENNL